jgi:hypothetical protein
MCNVPRFAGDMRCDDAFASCPLSSCGFWARRVHGSPQEEVTWPLDLLRSFSKHSERFSAIDEADQFVESLMQINRNLGIPRSSTRITGRAET